MLVKYFVQIFILSRLFFIYWAQQSIIYSKWPESENNAINNYYDYNQRARLKTIQSDNVT